MEIRKTSLIQRLSTLSFFVQSLKKQLFPEHHHPVM